MTELDTTRGRRSGASGRDGATRIERPEDGQAPDEHAAPYEDGTGPEEDGTAPEEEGATSDAPMVPRGRGVFCNRTLNLRSVRAIGYDMDYTLVHYHSEAWERSAYEHIRRRLLDRGWPVADLVYDPDMAVRGLIIDRDLGNLVKANRFGYVKQVAHGTRPLGFEEQRRLYSRVPVDLGDGRWVFINTLFALSEATMYSQVVDLLDDRLLPEVLGYDELYGVVRDSLDEALMEGQLKSEIVADPDRYVDLDPDAVVALLDQHNAGKRLLLITNSDWPYTRSMMSHAFDRYLGRGITWRDLFDLVIVWARKPDFFDGDAPVFEVVSDDGLLRPSPGGILRGGVYAGGSAALVERYLGLDSADFLYVGDHIYADVHVSKSVRRWRTALILRELEAEVEALAAFHESQTRLNALMSAKVETESRLAAARLAHLRRRRRAAPGDDVPEEELLAAMAELRARIVDLDADIAPLARAAGELSSSRWGLLMRTGNDKSHLAYQVERHADIYTSRVGNFAHVTPFAYFRSPRGSLPHDPL